MTLSSLLPAYLSPSTFQLLPSFRYLKRSKQSATAIASLAVAILLVGLAGTAKNASALSIGCNCVVFRLDDIQDSWIRDVQLVTLDTFLSTSTKVSPGIIMNAYGADDEIVKKMDQGKNSGLFELALHGWNHVDYGRLSLADQKSTLADANAKLNAIHEQKSNIFITPYNSMNQNTLTAAKENELKIISADLVADGSPPFLPKTFPQANVNTVKSLPMTVDFIDRSRLPGPNGKNIALLADQIDASIANRGWAIMMLHPQDFASYSSDRKAQNVVNETQMSTLHDLVAKLKSDGRTITSFDKLVASYGSQVISKRAEPSDGTVPPAAENEMHIKMPPTIMMTMTRISLSNNMALLKAPFNMTPFS